MSSHRRTKSDTFHSLLLRTGHEDLAPRHASARLSRVVRSDAERIIPLQPSNQNDLLSFHPSFESSPFRTPCRQQQVPDACNCNNDTVQKLLSSPLMEPIIKVVENSSLFSVADGLQDEIISALSDAMNDCLSPWAKLMPKPPPITGPRTPEQYLCAIDVALNARRETKRWKKIVKYWKRLALQANSSESDTLLTPSPSAISDTGLSEALSSPRKDRVNELMRKRRPTVLSLSGDVLNTSKITSEDLPANSVVANPHKSKELSDFDSVHDICDTPSLSQDSTSSSADEIEKFPVTRKLVPRTKFAKSSIPSLKGSRPVFISPMTSPEPSEETFKSFYPRKGVKTSLQMSEVTSSVQSKCRVYESLALSSTPGRIPVASIRTGIGLIDPTSRRISPKSSQITCDLSSPRTDVVVSPKASLRRPRPSRPTQLNSSSLPQARRKTAK